jgi:chromosome segregation ATPase
MVGQVKSAFDCTVNLTDLSKARSVLEERLNSLLHKPRQAAIEAGIALLDRLVEANKNLTSLAEQIREMEDYEKELRAEAEKNKQLASSSYTDWRDAEADLKQLKLHCLAAGIPLPEGMTAPEPDESETDDTVSEEEVSDPDELPVE